MPLDNFYIYGNYTSFYVLMYVCMSLCTISDHTLYCVVIMIGYIGIVRDATETTARIELHTTCTTISVDRSRIAEVTA